MMRHDKPLVSVVVPCYNGGRYLAETLDSILGQTYLHWECVIVDDGSTDDSLKLSADFCRKDSRFRLISKPNGGLGSARNAGIAASTGELIAFLDADDKWHPEKLTLHVNHLQKRPGVGVSYSGTLFINEEGKRLWSRRMPYLSNLSDYYLFCRNPITNGSNGIFRKEVLLAHPFDEEISHNQDVDCWLRIAFDPKNRWLLEGIPRFLTYYRVNSGGLSNNYEKHHACATKVWNKVMLYNPKIALRYRKTAEAFQLRFYSRRAIASRDYRQARRYIKQSLLTDVSIILREPVSTLTTLLVAFTLPGRRVPHKR